MWNADTVTTILEGDIMPGGDKDSEEKVSLYTKWLYPLALASALGGGIFTWGGRTSEVVTGQRNMHERLVKLEATTDKRVTKLEQDIKELREKMEKEGKQRDKQLTRMETLLLTLIKQQDKK